MSLSVCFSKMFLFLKPTYLKGLSHLLYILTVEITQDAFDKQLLGVSLRLLKEFWGMDKKGQASSGVHFCD